MKHKKKRKLITDDTFVIDGREYNLNFLNFCDLLHHIEKAYDDGHEFCKSERPKKHKRK